jgi:quercetin dioxygenase-like cupin family protein
MARSGEVLNHPVTAERIVWRKVAADTGGRMIEADLYAAPGAAPAAEHVHPQQEERFRVEAGTLRLVVDGTERLLNAGDEAVVPAGRPHTWWNAGTDEAHVVATITPALRTEMFFETFFGLAIDGKTNRKGLPNPLQLAVIMRGFADEIRLARPAPVVQRILFGPLAIVGRLLGYRPWYPRYGQPSIRTIVDRS